MSHNVLLFFPLNLSVCVRGLWSRACELRRHCTLFVFSLAIPHPFVKSKVSQLHLQLSKLGAQGATFLI